VKSIVRVVLADVVAEMSQTVLFLHCSCRDRGVSN